VRAERLKEALAKAGRLIAPPSSTASEAEPENQFLRATVGGKTLLVKLDEIICLVAEDKYTTVHLRGAKTVINDSLVDLEQRFPEKFMRIHRNSLVAPKFIRGLEKNTTGACLLQMAGLDFKPEVSRRKVSAIRKFIRDVG
jgi:two-component system response regulator AlgR